MHPTDAAKWPYDRSKPQNPFGNPMHRPHAPGIGRGGAGPDQVRAYHPFRDVEGERQGRPSLPAVQPVQIQGQIQRESEIILNRGKLHEGTEKQWEHYNRCLLVAHGLARFVMWGVVYFETADRTLDTMANSQPLPRHFCLGNILGEFEKSIGYFNYIRQKAPWKIKDAIKPFIEARKPSVDIWLLAMDVNYDKYEYALSPQEVVNLVGNELKWACRRMRSHHAG
jgi:hypothetical protein